MNFICQLSYPMLAFKFYSSQQGQSASDVRAKHTRCIKQKIKVHHYFVLYLQDVGWSVSTISVEMGVHSSALCTVQRQEKTTTLCTMMNAVVEYANHM